MMIKILNIYQNNPIIIIAVVHLRGHHWIILDKTKVIIRIIKKKEINLKNRISDKICKKYKIALWNLNKEAFTFHLLKWKKYMNKFKIKMKIILNIKNICGIYLEKVLMVL